MDRWVICACVFVWGRRERMGYVYSLQFIQVVDVCIPVWRGGI